VTQDQRIAVQLGARSYDIVVGSGLMGRAGLEIASVLRRPDTIIVTDSNVTGTPHLKTLERSLEAAGVAHRSILLPAGEATKSMAQLDELLNRLFDLGIERATTIVALGGGVVGDLAGFAAAVALRGLDYVQVPTTLLAQVDSAIGGKTGINTRQGKNLVGAFHQPQLVLADVAVLGTLPPRELRAGYAEVVKYGLIDRPAFFDWLEEHGREVLAGDPAAQQYAVVECCRAKSAVVAADEREGGARALLNLGHTFAHALESTCGYGGTLLHGEAVALGLVLAFGLSVRLGLCPAEDADRVRAHLGAVGLPTTLGAIRSHCRRCPAGRDGARQEGQGRSAALRPDAWHRPGVRRRRGRSGAARSSVRGCGLIGVRQPTCPSHDRAPGPAVASAG
jgi:3-dehydroquinate synthase